MEKNSYGLINNKDNKTIYQYSVPKDANKVEIFERSFPTTPISGIMFHIIPSETISFDAIAMRIKDQITDDDPNIFIIDLNDEAIGSYYFAGLVVDSLREFEDFFSDLKSGKIQIAIVNAEKAYTLTTVGMVFEQITAICGSNEEPNVHIFLNENKLADTIIDANEIMKEYFIKNRGEVVGG